MEAAADGTGPIDRKVAPIARRSPGWIRAAGLFLLGASACTSLWPTSHAVVSAAPGDLLACAAAEAKQLGYRVLPDTTHGTLTAQKTLPERDRGPDVTEYSRKNVLQVSFSGRDSARTTALSVRAETITVQVDRRGMTDVPESALPDVRADADSLLARCRHATSNSSLP